MFFKPWNVPSNFKFIRCVGIWKMRRNRNLVKFFWIEISSEKRLVLSNRLLSWCLKWQYRGSLEGAKWNRSHKRSYVKRMISICLKRYPQPQSKFKLCIGFLHFHLMRKYLLWHKFELNSTSTSSLPLQR